MKPNQVYPDYRIDKNISWFNVVNYPLGILYGIVAFEWIHNQELFIKRLRPPKFWLPMVWKSKRRWDE